jgi:Uma2 family endonuclease
LVRLILRLALPVPTDVILANESVGQPDLLFVVRERQGMIDPAGGVYGAPDLVLEILSPSTASRDQVDRGLSAAFRVVALRELSFC